MTDVYTILQKAKELGYSAEVFMSELNKIQIKREKQYQNMHVLDKGYGLRLIKDKKLGFAYGNRLEGLLELAIDSLKASNEDEYLTLPSPEKINRVNLKFFDISQGEEKIRELMSFGNEVRETVNVLSEYYEALNVKVKVVSTEGIDVEEDRSLLGFNVAYNVKSSDTLSPEIYEYIASRTLDFKLEKLKDKITFMKNIFSKNRVKLERKPTEVKFTPKALAELLVPLFSSSISLENYIRGKSPLKEGEVINPNVEIVDNPLIQNAPYSRSFDAEGLPSKVNYLIKRGMINKLLSNTYWSLRSGKENTHSASRNYSTTPFISPSILEINVFENHESDIVIDQVQGVHTSNFDTGEFSVVIPIAWNEKEEVAYRELTLSGNLKDLLKGIAGKAGEKELYGNLYSASLIIKGVNVS